MHLSDDERFITSSVTVLRSSRVPSADSIPQQVEAPPRPSVHHGQQMSRQTLQALSAVPRPRIVQADQWVQRRKSDVPRAAQDYNYQHWLIQVCPVYL
jgi:F-box protein 20